MERARIVLDNDPDDDTSNKHYTLEAADAQILNILEAHCPLPRGGRFHTICHDLKSRIMRVIKLVDWNEIKENYENTISDIKS